MTVSRTSLSALLALPLLLACGSTPDAAPQGSADAQAPAADAPAASAGATADAAPAGEKPSLVQEPQVQRSGGWQHYGETFTTAEDSAISCTDLLADPASHVDQTVRVTGRVADVCQKKGCWMVLTPKEGDAGEQLIRVTMKDHAFGIDMAGTGREVELEGTLISKAIDPETVAHYESEAAKPETIPENKVEGDVTYELVAHVVRLRNPS